jgi:hypothetical protein
LGTSVILLAQFIHYIANQSRLPGTPVSSTMGRDISSCRIVKERGKAMS